MRTTIVPAQITTIEDRIAGSLSLTQMLLLAIPMFGGSAAYIVFPPFNSLALYKVVIIIGLLLIFGVLAVRVRGKLLINWLAVVIRYRLRPQLYVYNKNSQHLREYESEERITEVRAQTVKPSAIAEEERPAEAIMSASEIVRLERLMNDPNFRFSFKTNRKGKVGMYVAQRNQS